MVLFGGRLSQVRLLRWHLILLCHKALQNQEVSKLNKDIKELHLQPCIYGVFHLILGRLCNR